jgi:hypothetical protein
MDKMGTDVKSAIKNELKDAVKKSRKTCASNHLHGGGGSYCQRESMSVDVTIGQQKTT